jgi:hypothetical protein
VEFWAHNLGSTTTFEPKQQSLRVRCFRNTSSQYRLSEAESMGELAERPHQRGRTTKSATATSGTWHGPRLLYLTAYNILFASLWALVFLEAISHTSDGKIELFAATEPHARWIQTASLIEVLHAAFGMSAQPSICGSILTPI